MDTDSWEVFMKYAVDIGVPKLIGWTNIYTESTLIS
jgi:hypothetical protein